MTKIDQFVFSKKNKEMTPVLAELFKVDTETLGLILLSDKVAYDLMQEENPNEILKVAGRESSI